MRKYPITRDFKHIDKPGVLIMNEHTNINMGKMMDIDDEIRMSYSLTKDNILLPLIKLNEIHNTSYDKIKKDSILEFKVADVQTESEKDTVTKWIIKINYKHILREFLYHEIHTYNPYSVFKKMVNILPENRINDYCYAYIDFNILDRYKVKEIILWTEYHELKRDTVPGTGTNTYNPLLKLLRKTPIFTYHAIPSPVLDSKKETISTKSYNDGTIDILYQQTKSSQYYTFLYYYDIIFERI
jgi:hypothetical protein